MNVLAFDCTTRSCSAALVRDGQTVSCRATLADRGQAQILMPMIEAVLAEAGLTWPEIGLLGVTVGPGTFTGVRIGLATARGLALAGKMATAGVVTTLAIAHAVPLAERLGRTLLAVVDGKRADLFVQGFDSALVPLGDPVAAMPEDLARMFPGPLLLAGDGAPRALPCLGDAVLSSILGGAKAAVVAALAARDHALGRALRLDPLYLRPADVTLPKAPP